jgi:hypothetical protein
MRGYKLAKILLPNGDAITIAIASSFAARAAGLLGNGKGSTSAGTVDARTDLASAGGANAGGFVPAFPGGSPITFGNPSPVVPPPQPPVDCTAPLAALLNPCCKPPDPNSSTCPVGCKP